MAVEFVFFDIGGTLGERNPSTGKLVPFPSTVGLLKSVRDDMGLRLGVITTLRELTNDEGRDLVAQAGLSGFFDPHGFVSEHDVSEKRKPKPEIYRFAAQQVGVPIDRCLYVGENLIEVIGAMAAGMCGMLKPSPPGRELPV